MNPRRSQRPNPNQRQPRQCLKSPFSRKLRSIAPIHLANVSPAQLMDGGNNGNFAERKEPEIIETADGYGWRLVARA
jgi:hypothetical protein